jgi:hypothetical protein
MCQDCNPKGAHFRHPTETAHPSRPRTILLFCRIVISKTKEIGVPPQPSSRISGTPHIVIYSYLNNHSASLKKVNEKLALMFVKYCRSKMSVTTSYSERSTRTTSLYINSLITNLLTSHLTSVVSPPSVSNAINHM